MKNIKKTDTARNQTKNLTILMSLGGLNGTVSIAALAGLFKIENIFLLSILFIAGPGAILTAFFLDGDSKVRILSALLAGIIATIIVILAAGIGVKALLFLNITLLKFFGGLAVVTIGLLIIGIKIPDKLPMLIILAGIIFSLLFK